MTMPRPIKPRSGVLRTLRSTAAGGILSASRSSLGLRSAQWTVRTTLIALFIAAFTSFATAESPIQSIRVVRTDDTPVASDKALSVSPQLPSHQKLSRTLAPHLGQPTTEAELGTLADLVVDHLKQHHWPVSLVSVWDEDDGLAQGRVTLQVQQGKIGDIAIVGGSARRQHQVATRLQDLAHTPLDGLQLQRRLDALAFSPWLACTPQAMPGATLDTANLLLTLQDESPLHAFASYENNGVEPLGENRYTLGVQWLNAFALGHDLIFASTIADDPETLTMLAGSWRIPLPWRHELRLSGYYAESNSSAEVLTIPLEVNGITWATSARYIIPHRLTDHWRGEWQLGFDYKQFNTDFTFGGTGVLGDTTGVGTAVIGTQWFYQAPKNQARLALEVAHGEPEWAKGQNEDEYEELTPGASPRFTTVRADASFQHEFKNQLQAALRLGAQWSDGPVLPSEELSLSGATTVRGYPERSIRASRGAWSSLEARSPVWSIKSQFKLRAIAFADAGWMANNDAPQDYIASAGIGLHSDLTKHLQLRCDFAFPLTDAPDDFRLHLAAVLRF